MQPLLERNDWKYFWNGNYFEVRGKISQAHPNIIVFETPRESFPDFQEEDICEKDQAEVYARLCAAAPDMLEALENLENDDNSIPDHAWKMVKDAIAKARG